MTLALVNGAIDSASFFGNATWPDIATFIGASLMVLAGAIGVITTRNPVHAALSLVLTLFGVAVLFVAQQAHFLAAVQVIVYAGAIVVMFLFVIMLLGVDRVDAHGRERLKVQRPLALLFAVATVAMIVAIGGVSFDDTGARSQGGTLSGAGSDIGKLADSIFTQYLLPFELTSLLLVIAVVGAVVLARRPGADEEKDQAVEMIPSGSERPGAEAETEAEEESEAGK